MKIGRLGNNIHNGTIGDSISYLMTEVQRKILPGNPSRYKCSLSHEWWKSPSCFSWMKIIFESKWLRKLFPFRSILQRLAWIATWWAGHERISQRGQVRTRRRGDRPRVGAISEKAPRVAWWKGSDEFATRWRLSSFWGEDVGECFKSHWGFTQP